MKEVIDDNRGEEAAADEESESSVDSTEANSDANADSIKQG